MQDKTPVELNKQKIKQNDAKSTRSKSHNEGKSAGQTSRPRKTQRSKRMFNISLLLLLYDNSATVDQT